MTTKTNKTRLDGKLVVLDITNGNTFYEGSFQKIKHNIERYVGTYSGFENGMHVLENYLPVTVDPRETSQQIYFVIDDMNVGNLPHIYWCGSEIANIINKKAILPVTYFSAAHKITPFLGSLHEQEILEEINRERGPGTLERYDKRMKNNVGHASIKNMFKEELEKDEDFVPTYEDFTKKLKQSLEILREREGGLQ
jgi:hypothetical protein